MNIIGWLTEKLLLRKPKKQYKCIKPFLYTPEGAYELGDIIEEEEYNQLQHCEQKCFMYEKKKPTKTRGLLS